MHIVSYFDNVKGTTQQTLPISEIFKTIGNGKLKEATKKIRMEKDKKIRNLLKSTLLPAITTSGIFKKSHALKDFLKHSGLIQVDIDEIDDPNFVKKQLSFDKYTLACFLSPSGNGVKAIVKIPAEKDNHLSHFNALKSYYLARYDLSIDEKCKDLSRMMYLCSDEDLFLNEHSEIFEVFEKPILKPKSIQSQNNNGVKEDLEHVIQQIETRNIDITSEYNDWLAIGYAFADEFGESGRDYFHRVSKFYPGYNFEDAEKQFSNCVKSAKGNGIKPFFALAKRNGIKLGRVNLPEKPGKDYFNNSTENKQKHDFYKIQQDATGKFKSIKINKVKLIKFLKNFGFFRYDIDTNTFKYVHLKNRTIKEVSKHNITDAFDKYVSDLEPYRHFYTTKEGDQTIIIDSEKIKEAIYDSLDRLFSENLLNRLTPDFKIEIQRDTKNKKYFYYKNGFVEVSKHGLKFLDYSMLNKFIWADQILDRDFNNNQEKGNYERFFNNVCNNDEARILSLKTITGYLLHNYMDRKLFATILSDSQLSDDNEPNGRSGKTLFMKSLGMMLNSNKNSTTYVEINGKDKKDDKHKYDQCSLNTQLLHLNDVKRNFQIETLFNDITEGITVDKKNQTPYSIQVKLAISSNLTIVIEGESSVDRVRVFEFSDYYSSKLSPDKEFKQWFFTDWDDTEWKKFDSFIMNCCIEYFKNDCEVIEPDTLTLHRRTLIEHTSAEFVNFMDRCTLGEPEDNISPLFEVGVPYVKKELYEKFLEEYTDYSKEKLKQRSFTKWVKQYLKKSDIQFDEKRSNGVDYLVIMS